MAIHCTKVCTNEKVSVKNIHNREDLHNAAGYIAASTKLKHTDNLSLNYWGLINSSLKLAEFYQLLK